MIRVEGMTDITFADRVHAMTFETRLRSGQHISNDARFVLARHRANLRIAERFILDDDAVRWTMTMLATINALPRDVRPIATRAGSRTVGNA